MNVKPIIFGCAGPSLSAAERTFFAEERPFGFILFQRNCIDPDQVHELTSTLRDIIGRNDTPIFIDQEGGRVARLKPPYWPSLPPQRLIGQLYERNSEDGISAMQLHARLTAHMLTELGINGNCTPVLDLFIEGASSAIGDRAFSNNPKVVSALARIAIETYLNNGVLPVIKHLPGHGRVTVDPHLTLPVVETDRTKLGAEDFIPFITMKEAPIGMNCHVVFKELDDTAPVSLSSKVHEEIIRGTIGFEGLLISDDLDMKALNGPLDETAEKALKAGADILLFCPGTMPEMVQIVGKLPSISEAAQKRWQRARAMLHTPQKPYDPLPDMKQLELLCRKARFLS